MSALNFVSWVVVDKYGEHDPVHTFTLLRQQENARPEPNLAAQLDDLTFSSICALLAVDLDTTATQIYGALLPSETMMRLQEGSWESIKSSLAQELAKTPGRRTIVRIGLMERLEETAGGAIALDCF